MDILLITEPFSTRVREGNSKQYPDIGEDKTFWCDITKRGTPNAMQQVQWFFNGTRLSVNQDGKYRSSDQFDQQFVITNLQKNDTGLYTCRIDNGQGYGDMEPYILEITCKDTFHKYLKITDVSHTEYSASLCHLCQNYVKKQRH